MTPFASRTFSVSSVFILLAIWRGRIHARGVWPGALYLITTGLLVAALTLQSHLGGMMSFGGGKEPSPSQDAMPASPSIDSCHRIPC